MPNMQARTVGSRISLSWSAISVDSRPECVTRILGSKGLLGMIRNSQCPLARRSETRELSSESPFRVIRLSRTTRVLSVRERPRVRTLPTLQDVEKLSLDSPEYRV